MDTPDTPEASAFLTTPLLVLSPHADDAALSCGGLLLQHDDAAVITVFSGQNPVPRPAVLDHLPVPEERRREDKQAMTRMDCEHWNLPFPDAIDRVASGRRIYTAFADLFGAVNPVDTELCHQIQSQVEEKLAGRTLLCPMAVGAHVDHQLCAHVGRRLQMAGHDVWFYPEAPYCYADPGPTVMSDTALLASRRLQARIWSNRVVEIDSRAKVDVISCYPTQVIDLFGDLLSYEYLAEAHYSATGGEVEIYHQLRW